MILCVGATGLLGSTVVEELLKRGKAVRCFVRQGSDTSRLKKTSVEIVRGNLRDRQSLSAALQGIDAVISSFATNIIKERNAAALWENDYEGNLSLIKYSREAGVKKFIFVSYWGLAKFGNFEHGKIKKVVEDLLAVSGIDYTVFRVTTLATDMSLLLGNRLLKKGWAPLFMKPYEKIRPILLEDLSWCMADALDNQKASCRVIEVAGKEEYDFISFQELFRKASGKPVRFVFIPLWLTNFIASCIDFATNSRYNARGLVSAFTGGSTCDISEMEKIFAIQQGSFAQHLENFFNEVKTETKPKAKSSGYPELPAKA
jgi:uncharacterized protein YbjT (DUF2867 family)